MSVYAPFRANDFIKGIFSDTDLKIDFRLFDGIKVSGETLLFASHTMKPLADHPPLFTAQKTLEIFGHQWTLIFKTLPFFEAGLDQHTPKLILAVSICVSLFIFAFLKMFENTGNKAFSMARDMTSALRIIGCSWISISHI